MNIVRHIEYDLELKASDDLTCLASDLEDFATDKNYADYKKIVSDYLLEKSIEDFLVNVDIKIKRVWYEVEKGKNE